MRLSLDETSPLGRFLIVMDAVDGRPPMDGLGARELLMRLPVLTRDLPDLLAGVAADLHSLDPEPLAGRLALLDEPLPLTAAAFVEENGRLAAGIGRRDLVGAAERLLAAEPAAEGRVVAHGDLHPLNVLMAPTGPVLVDWTLARVTDPAFTLGFTVLVLAEPPISLPGPGAAVLRRVGARLVERFLRSYRRRTDGTSAEVGDTRLRWHRDVHALRILVESAVSEERGDVICGGHPWTLLEPVARRLLGVR